MKINHLVTVTIIIVPRIVLMIA